MKHLLHYRKLKNSTKKTITCCRYLLRLHGVEPPPSGQLFSQIIFNFVVFVALAPEVCVSAGDKHIELHWSKICSNNRIVCYRTLL